MKGRLRFARLARLARLAFFVVVSSGVAFALVGGPAEAKPPRVGTAAPVRPPAVPKPPRKPPPTKDAGAAAQDAGPTAREPEDGGVVEVKGDGGKSFRFEALEVEGRLKSPQIVYFLRRVRAEFAAGDLGHRSFSHEMSETRNEPSF